MNRTLNFVLVFLALALAPASMAAKKIDAEVQERIASRFPGVAAEDVRPSPIEGLYEVMVGPMVIYTSADGRYMVRGEIIDLNSDRNLTEPRVEIARKRALSSLDENDVVVFGDAGAAHTVTVFTDVDCGYCREMHKQIDQYNARGIRIRYAAFPRNGLSSETWQTMEQVWCAEDRQAALTRAKQDKSFKHRQCNADDTIMAQWQLGRMLGVRGTPAIFTSDGEMIPGYLPPDRLLRRLQAERN